MTIIDLLHDNSSRFPDKTAFIFLEDGENIERKISFSELNSRVHQLGLYLISNQLANQKVILLYQDSLEFIVSFLACQLSGTIAIPAYFSRGRKQIIRVQRLIIDAQSNVVLTTTAISAYLEKEKMDSFDKKSITVISTNLDENFSNGIIARPVHQKIAFIQYTSGSTSAPKGVMVSNENLLYNQKSIKEAFGCDEDSIIFSWLPFHHDMGLIGNILHAIYIGCTCVMMSPYHFVQKPIRWLNAIKKYSITHSGAPNFAYDLCTCRIANSEVKDLDLSSWKVAYCGSEPVLKETADRFLKKFQPAGFSQSFFYPCYGLAEATLLVSGKRLGAKPVTIFIDSEYNSDGKISLTSKASPRAKSLIGSGGIVSGTIVKIISGDRVCGDLEEGEICISGSNVTNGYWNRDNTNVFCEIDGSKFLKTGDLGFIYKDELFVHGRIKEIIIIRGKNYYPQDLEQIVFDCDEAIENNGVVVFNADPFKDDIVILAEIKRNFINQINYENLISVIGNAIQGTIGSIQLNIFLISPFGIPRTTSGKLKRVESRNMYLNENFNVISTSKRFRQNLSGNKDQGQIISEVLNRGDYLIIRKYLLTIIENKLGIKLQSLNDEVELVDIGIDSLRSMEIVNKINRDLAIHLDASTMFHINTLFDFINVIENLIWLKNGTPTGKEITI